MLNKVSIKAFDPADNQCYRNFFIAKRVVKVPKNVNVKYPKGCFDNEKNRLEAEQAFEEYKRH